MQDYDIEKAFAVIEKELIASMIRNMKSHKAEEVTEGFQWEQWQVKQLESLEKYKKQNRKKFQKPFSDINGSIEGILSAARTEGGMSQEIAIMNAIKKGWKPPKALNNSVKTSAEFFKLNDRKLEALIKATTQDFTKAEHAMLRMADDQYRKIIFNAQVYANTGAGTYKKAVDMATKDFLTSGINCIEYKNGARHTIKDYAAMAIQTAAKRAYLTGEGEKRQEWGISTVIMNKRGNPCPKCLPFVGKILIDDVWSGGKSSDGPYKLMSSAISAGLYHPRCKDSHTTYFPGISTPPDGEFTQKEIKEIEKATKEDVKQQNVQRQVVRLGRLAGYSLDSSNKRMYEARAEEWRGRVKNADFKTGSYDSSEYKDSKILSAYEFNALVPESVVNTLRKNSENWERVLTEAEKNVINEYTGTLAESRPKFYERLNAMLRGKLPFDKALHDKSEILSKAVLKNKLEHDIICYRGVDLNPFDGLKPNTIYEEKSFVSTSVVQSGALDKGFKITYIVKKGSRGAYIEPLSNYKKQREFLLDKNNRYRLISINEREAIVEVI